MEAGKRIITDIFNRARQLEIPFFQRAYVWTRDNWERFLDDMEATSAEKQPYFMGSVILKQRSTDSGSTVGDVRVVVDGQQRLTTLALFFKALTDAHDLAGMFETTFRTFKGAFILQHNHMDVEVFEAVLSGKLTDELRVTHKGHRVLEAFTFFESQVERLKKIEPTVLFEKVHFVGIDLASNEDEQQIFDTINSLGVALTTAELLKNELFTRHDLALYKSHWREVFEEDKDLRDYWEQPVTAGRTRRSMIDLFLQSFLQSQEGVKDDLRIEHLFKEFQTHLRVMTVPRETLIKDLSTNARRFRDHIRAEVVDEVLDVDNAVDRLNLVIFGLNTTTVLPYVLAVLNEVGSSQERSKVLRLIETFLIRRLICRETTKNYNNLFTSFVRQKLDTHDKLLARLVGSSDPTTRMPSDDAVRKGFEQSNLSNEQARLLLYLLEANIRDSKLHATNLSGLKHYSLEHIMPKNWPAKWGSLPKAEAEVRDDLVRKLGNLTILPTKLNTTIRDSAWLDKRKGVGKGKGLDAFAAGLEILADALKLEVWDENSIRARGTWLAERALSIWPNPAPEG